jgi:thiamine pyrophosphate-dependent acetolactate synthase large subunit-like protein
VNAVHATAALLEALPEALFVASLGTATSALRQVSDDGPHLYLGGAMGSAVAVAHGVADMRPRRDVVALVGDGELLMRAGCLWSVAGGQPPNLVVAVLTNGVYGITGGQPLGVPSVWTEVAAALGLDAAAAATPAEAARAAVGLARPGLLDLAISEPSGALPSPFVDPPVVRWRFEQAATAPTKV